MTDHNETGQPVARDADASGRMSRRALLAASAGLAAGGCASVSGKISSQTATASAVAVEKEELTPDALTWMPAWRLRGHIVRGHITALEATNHFLSRIECLEPRLHMFRAVDHEGARAQAAAADKALAAGEPPGLLHGVPVSTKEHISIEGLPSLHLGPSATGLQGEASFPVAQHDSIVAERLRTAGAILIGVNIMPGMGRGSGMPDLSGHPRNPWDPARAPGSSSAGGAAAVACGAVPIAIGSDGGGSTRLPSALCGVFGVHPTAGAVPNLDIDDPSVRMTVTFGPITRDVRDAAMIMKAIAGPDGRDIVSTVRGEAPDYLSQLDKGAAGLELVWTDDFGFAGDYAVDQSPQVVAAVRNAADGVTQLGARLTETGETWESFWPHVTVTDTLFGRNPNAPVPSQDAMRTALQVRQRNVEHFRKMFETCDIMLSPVIQFTARTVEEWDASWRDILGFTPTYTSETFMFNWLGMPAVSIPCGFVDGLPIGLQAVGPVNSEPKLFRFAQAFMARFPQNARPQLA